MSDIGDSFGRRDDLEPLDSFGERARRWAVSALPPLGDDTVEEVDLQRALFDAGFAGIAMPAMYGGGGLSLEHQQVFYDYSVAGRRVPTTFSTSIAILGSTLLDEGGEELKRLHLPAILRGEERWIQLLSEPSGGSDMAAAVTRLDREGEHYVLNGSKIWSTGAKSADWGLCLARSDFDLPKHKGLSMIAVPLHSSGVMIQPIRHANGDEDEFCQEFFTDVVLPAGNLVGHENDGWKVARTLIRHERLAAGGAGHGYGLSWRSGGDGGLPSSRPAALVAAARRQLRNGALRSQVADAYIERTVALQANRRIMMGIRTGRLDGAWGSALKLHLGVSATREAKTALSVSGADGVIWDGCQHRGGRAGEDWLVSRGPSLGGGTNEMQRNLLAEQILGLPRDPAVDLDRRFSEVLRSRGRS